MTENTASTASTPLSPEDLLAIYDVPGASAAEFLCDRHDPDAVAFTVIDPDLSGRDITYGELRTESEKVAAALAALGVAEGDRVATLMSKSADLVFTLMGIWRLGAVHMPLFTAFAWPAIEMRITGGDAKVIVSDADQRGKLESTSVPVVVAGLADCPESREGDLDLDTIVAAQEPGRPAAVTGPDAGMVMLFTSGTTGTPKGVVVPVRALAAFHQYIETGLDVRADDVFWNGADPGWAYGLYYGILGPLAVGRRSLLLHARYTPELAFAVLQYYRVTNFAAAPTVYRTMRAKRDIAPADVRLRRASAAGEPLTPEVIEWSREQFGVEVRDQYGQTEHGMFIINPWHDSLREEVRPGSMGVPLPGWSCTVLAADSDDPAPAGELGRVAIDVPASPLMWFTGYHEAPEKTAERFSADGRWYYTGDAAKLDADGHFYFSSRDDDVIIMSGYRIGPFDVESVLAKHPDVLESAVIGVPDELAGEVLEAYVVLRDGVDGGPETESALQAWVKTEFAAHAFPRKVHFVRELPKTPSGKIQRFLLRKERSGQA
ncbi:AMP-dependent synthetase [Dietzia sp. HMSC21D01]|uniref:AMP-binding protein n=1 Tax=Dietzia cinnamea TaxID=321318 RepID=A0AAW5Q7T4_9ACTN|nr:MULTISPECIES: AMP-binding protein [Dietzia]PWD96470.1 AMP-dependent synthetase [Dietzia maris]MBM7229740.1 AMP-binding protein [Dietzia cinnamea]MCT1638771.1 AMP-binding protein [Dietzia cinnamea]MCT1863189.1 AMP-binding protein [Dietzia cinnamea]MCT2029666.1 AMP-binding protein [Dietzia cinnamea]